MQLVPYLGEMVVSSSESTCWTMIRAAAAGSATDREELARRYLGVVRAYLAARWRGTVLRDDRDDATQAVFVECFRQGGALEAAGTGRVPRFPRVSLRSHPQRCPPHRESPLTGCRLVARNRRR